MRGLDQEMPGGEHMGSALLKAVQSGAIPEAAVDDSVRRIRATFPAVNCHRAIVIIWDVYSVISAGCQK